MQQRRDQHRRGEHHQRGRRDHAPDEDRQPRPRQSRGPHGHDRRDHVQPEQRHRDADEREEDDVAVHPRVRLDVQRLVARPAGGEAAEEDGRLEDHAAGHEQPERQRLDARERHAPCADQDRDQVVAERAEDPARHHPHHHRAVEADDRQVRAGGEHLVRRAQQLDPDQHRVQAADEQEGADSDEVLDADDLVVGAEPEVAADPLRLLLPQRRRIAAQPGERVVEEAEPDQEADHAAEIREHDRQLVRVDRGEVGDARALDQVRRVPADVPADDRRARCR